MSVALDLVAPLKLQHHGHNVPVTALSVLGQKFVLAGQGSRLICYDLDRAVPIASWRIFKSQAIHGLATNKSTILIWGGHLVRVAQIVYGPKESVELLLGASLNVKDWIFDIAFCNDPTHDGKLSAAVVTAHNALTLLQISQYPPSDRFTATVIPLTSDTNSILYAAHIKWLSASQCLIASGTAFGDVILWSCTIVCNSEVYEAKTQIHYTFCAHEGSVFGVKLSDSVILPGRSDHSTVLASCSDDRTIRIWDISDLSKTSSSLIQMQNDTGFGSKLQRDSHAPLCIARTMGHVSRIWSVNFLCGAGGDSANFPTTSCDPHSTHLPILVSFGEDATVIHWELARPAMLDSGAEFTLKQISMSTAHAGKNIWSLALSEKRGLITGGADGSVVVYHEAVDNIAEPQVCVPLSPYMGQTGADTYRCYAFVGRDLMVAVTHQGQIIHIALAERRETMISTLNTPQLSQASLRGYSLACGFNGGAVLGSKSGALWLYEERSGRVYETTGLVGKVMSLFAYSVDEGTIYVLATCITTSEPALLMTLRVNADDGEVEIVLRKKVWLSLGSVASSFTCSSAKSCQHYLVGCRNGSVILFDSYNPEEPLRPIDVVEGVHHKEAVTSLLTRPDYNSIAPSYFIYSAGRDGTIAVYHYTSSMQQGPSSPGEIGTRLLHRVALPLGPNIERLEISYELHLLASGFRNKEFVVCDLTTQRDVMTVRCGGAHRSWVFQSSHAGGTFVWTKASKVYSQTQTILPYHSINSGGHGREVKAVATSNSRPQIIATGAEDTNIKLHSYDGNGNFRCLQTLRKHTTGIQHLQWSASGQYLFSSGGFEEFFVWRTTPDVPIIGVAVFCESQYPGSGSSDLRIMGFDAKEQTPADADTGHNFVIAMAYSDSTVKTWTYDASGWSLFASSSYLTACLTSISFLDAETLMSSATDGHIALWQTRSKLRWTTRNKIHQNAILNAVPHKLADGTTLLFTAGDDNAIGITRLAPAQNSEDGDEVQGREEMDTLLIPRAHAAAVTALFVFTLQAEPLAEPHHDNANGVHNRHNNTELSTVSPITATTPTTSTTPMTEITSLLLMSTSTDQRLKTWLIRLDSSQPGTAGLEVRRLGSVHTAVADAAGLSALALADDAAAGGGGGGATGVLVCGVGMDVWRVPEGLLRLGREMEGGDG